jgi:hypothetical protein
MERTGSHETSVSNHLMPLEVTQKTEECKIKRLQTQTLGRILGSRIHGQYSCSDVGKAGREFA